MASANEENYVEKWYHDKDLRQCQNFTWSGYLGNTNRFDSRQECEESCNVNMDTVPLCDLPVDAGPCRGQYERFYYDKTEGVCQPFNYTGCKGNANRFTSKAQCENACEHRARTIRAKRVCVLPKVAGTSCSVPKLLSRWYFDSGKKSCLPFYYNGCNGNDNNFASVEECEATCPNLYMPQVTPAEKVSTILENTFVEKSL